MILLISYDPELKGVLLVCLTPINCSINLKLNAFLNLKGIRR